MNSRDPLEVFNVFSAVWASWAGYPQRLRVDKGGAFEGELLDRMQRLGVEVEDLAAEAHWQAGEVETYNGRLGQGRLQMRSLTRYAMRFFVYRDHHEPLTNLVSWLPSVQRADAERQAPTS